MADLPALETKHSPKKHQGYTKGHYNKHPQTNGHNPGQGGAPRMGGNTSPLLPSISTVSHKSERTSLTGTPLTSLSSSRGSMHQVLAPSPTKLPTLVHKSSSIGSISSGNVRRTTSLPNDGYRAELCRSPSCPTLWSELQDDITEYEQEISLNGLDSSASVTRAMKNRGLSRSMNAKTDCSTKLPSIFGGAASNKGKNQDTVRRTQSLQSSLHLSLVDAPIIAPTKAPRSKREVSMMTALSMPIELQNKDRQGVSPSRRVDNALLLPMRDPPHKLKKSKSKRTSATTTPGIKQASEGTSGDSGVSVGRRPSDRSDSSVAQDGSEAGVGWEQDPELQLQLQVEVEMDDETQDGIVDSASARTVTKKREELTKNREGDNRSALSAEKCREWLESVSEDGTPRRSRAKKGNLKMPKIN